MQPGLVVIGASVGGLLALETILRGLNDRFLVPIVIVQHRHRASTGTIKSFLQDSTALAVQEVEDKDKILPGYVYLAPANYHLLVELTHFVLSIDEPVSYACPSIDVLFETAADAFAERTIGVILTGANHDGAAGSAAIKQQGGTLVVQEPATAESAVMPLAALARTPADWVLPLDKIADCLNQLCC